MLHFLTNVEINICIIIKIYFNINGDTKYKKKMKSMWPPT